MAGHFFARHEQDSAAAQSLAVVDAFQPDQPLAAGNLKRVHLELGDGLARDSFEEYTRVKHVMLELSGEAEKGWHYTIFGDKPR